MSDHDTITRLQGEAAVMIGLLTKLDDMLASPHGLTFKDFA